MPGPLYFITGKALNRPGGMEQHALAMLRGFWPQFYFVGVDIPGHNEVVSRYNVHDYPVYPVLSPLLARSAKSLKKIISPGSTVFFNEAQLLPLAVALKSTDSTLKIIMRSGGNDICGAALPYIAGPGSRWYNMYFKWISGKTYTTALSGPSFRAYRARMISHLNETADTLFVNSEYSRRTLSAAGIEDRLMQVVCGGVDPDDYAPVLHSPKRILTVVNACRLVSFKGLNHAIEAICLANTFSPDVEFRLKVYGSGPERKALQHLVRKNGVDDKVSLLPGILPGEIPGKLAEGDIFLHLPIAVERHRGDLSYTHTETMGRTIIEAAAAGLPVIVSSVGGVPELFKHGEFGFLVDPGDAVGAARFLVQLSDHRLRHTYGSMAREISERHFAWSNVFGLYREYLS